MKKFNILFVATVLFMAGTSCNSLYAQGWRAGVMFGGTSNHYSIDKQYMQDWKYENAWGFTAGLMGQYDFNDWLGVRAEVNWAQKNHKEKRSGEMRGINYTVYNNYVQVPVMASMSFGGTNLRGFLNAGVYGGWVAGSRRSGTMQNIFNNEAVGQVYHISEECFNKDRDRRFECGLVGGVGVDYRFAENWGAQVEGRCYYSTRSTTKHSDVISDHRYNTTLGVMGTVYYVF